MNAIEETLIVTQNLLCALEQDNSLLTDDKFISKISFLRSKHKETSDLLSQHVRHEPLLNHELNNATYHTTPGCNHYWTDIIVPHECHGEDKKTRGGLVVKEKTVGGPPKVVQDETAVYEVRQAKRPTQKIRSIHSAKPSLGSPKVPQENKSNLKNKSKSMTNLKAAPTATVPKPFKFLTRKPISNTYSKKFLDNILTEKERQEEQQQKELSDKPPFKATPVPATTYESNNELIKNDKYLEAIQKKVQAKLRRNYLSSRSKSNMDVSKIGRDVPPSTYYAPAPLDELRRGKKASDRANNMLVEARTPPGLKEHRIRTNLAFRLRHENCKKDKPSPIHIATSVPDFQRIHRDLEYQQRASTSLKKTTVPVPFNLSEGRKTIHRNCKSASPRRVKSSVMRLHVPPAEDIPETHSSVLRTQAVRKRMEKFNEKNRLSEAYWESKREEMEINKSRLLSTLKRSHSSVDIQRKTEEKRQNLLESSREYRKQLAEMRQRVLNRPLIMELQTTESQKQKFLRKYDETMKNIGNKKVPPLGSRRVSDMSGATFSVKTSPKQENYDSDNFESEDDNDNLKVSFKSNSSQKTSKSTSSSASSTKTSSSSTKSSKSSSSSSKVSSKSSSKS